MSIFTEEYLAGKIQQMKQASAAYLARAQEANGAYLAFKSMLDDLHNEQEGEKKKAEALDMLAKEADNNAK